MERKLEFQSQLGRWKGAKSNVGGVKVGNWDSDVLDVYAGLSREEMKGNGASGRVEQNRNVQCDDCYWQMV